MAYDISFRSSAESAFESLDNSLRTRTEQKLERVANDEFRSPAQWGYTPFAGQPAGGKFEFFDQVRIFAEIDEEEEEIIIHRAETRENLYR